MRGRKSTVAQEKHLLHESSIDVWIYVKSVKNLFHPILDAPIFESLLETSMLIEGLSSSGILVKVVILQLLASEALVDDLYRKARSSKGKILHQRTASEQAIR